MGISLKYQDLISNEDNVFILMKALELFVKATEIWKVDHHPDYDLSPYQGPITSNYIFKSSIDFPITLKSVYRIEFVNFKVFHSDCLVDLIIEHNLDAELDDGGKYILDLAIQVDKDVMDNNGFEPNFEQFNLNDIKPISINNEERKVFIEGSFFGDGDGIAPEDWNLYTEVSYYGFKSSRVDSDFFTELLSQSFYMYEEKNYRLSFFLSFSAVEGYVNERLESNDTEGRLSDKVNELFKVIFSNVDLAKHNIYTNVIAKFKRIHSPLRNHIAHGRSCEFTDESALEMLIVALVLIPALPVGYSSIYLGSESWV